MNKLSRHSLRLYMRASHFLLMPFDFYSLFTNLHKIYALDVAITFTITQFAHLKLYVWRHVHKYKVNLTI